MKTNRYNNYGLWAATTAFIVLVIQTFHIVELPKNYNEIINTFLGLLVLAGILNNPNTVNRGFKDDTNK